MKFLPSFFLLIFVSSATALAQMPPPMPGDYIFTGPQYVTNEPFSSVVENEHSQALADGTHIVSKTVLHLFRDSDGRTRREIYRDTPGVPPNTPVAIEIRDPVAGFAYNLHVQNHVALKLRMPHLPALRTEVDTSPPPHPPASSRPDDGLHPNITNEDLGTEFIQGCESRGHRMTRTTPVGLQGNDRPLVFIQEEWDCPEMRMMMSLSTTDQRFGNVTVRVTSLDRGEPDPGLFQLPADYKIVESEALRAP